MDPLDGGVFEFASSACGFEFVELRIHGEWNWLKTHAVNMHIAAGLLPPRCLVGNCVTREDTACHEVRAFSLMTCQAVTRA